MSYVKYTQTLVLDSGSSRGHAEASEAVVKPGVTLEELHEAMPGSRIAHGFQIIANNGRVLASRTGLPDEHAARRAVRELRRALLPGVRRDVNELAQAWDEGHRQGMSPLTSPGNPYREEKLEADREHA